MPYCNGRTSSDWSYPVSHKTQNQNLGATLVNSFPISPQKQRTRGRPDYPFGIEGSEDSAVQEDLVLKFRKPCPKPNQGDRFECCLLSPCQPNSQIKALYFLKGQCCSIGFYACQAVSPCLVTLWSKHCVLHFLIVYCLLHVY